MKNLSFSVNKGENLRHDHALITVNIFSITKNNLRSDKKISFSPLCKSCFVPQMLFLRTSDSISANLPIFQQIIVTSFGNKKCNIWH